MPNNYEKDKDVFIQRRTTNNTRFEEAPLIVSPNSVVGVDSSNDLVMIPIANFAQGVSASYAKTASVALNVPETASYALMGLSSSYAETATYAITTSYETSSFIITTVSADFAIVAFFADTASWASSSLSSSTSVYAETASYALNAAGGSSESSSWASSSLSSSYTITSSFANTASFALNVIGNSPSSSWASSSISSSYAPQAQDISVNSITASYISASSIVTVTPFYPNQVATKQYVDNFSSFGVNYYFRSSSSDVAPYLNMLTIDTPVTSSNPDLVTNAVSASQIFASFITPAINVTAIQQGAMAIHCHAYRVGGNAANTFTSQILLRSGSNERVLATGDAVLLTTNANETFDMPVIITASVITNLSDRLIVKFQCVNGAGTPNIHFLVENNTAAGIIVPIPATNFVSKAGDTMTGNLTVPQVIGTSSYAVTASYAMNGGGSAALTSSAQTTGSYTLVSDDNGKVITFENATTNSIIIPASLPTNFNCFLVSVSTGSVQITGSGGIELNNANNCFKLSGRYAAASLVGYLPEKYILFGDVSL